MGYHRNSAIRALSAKKRSAGTKAVVKRAIGRQCLYEPERLLPVLKKIWLIGQQPCGRRLQAMMLQLVLTIILSPLQALMKDQVDGLARRTAEQEADEARRKRYRTQEWEVPVVEIVVRDA